MKHYTFTDAITMTEALFVLFLGLKLAHCIDWSWWLVFTPLIYDFTLANVIRKYLDNHIGEDNEDNKDNKDNKSDE